MAVQKVRRRGRWMWRARVIVGGQEKTAFRRRKDEALEVEAEFRQRLKAEVVGGQTEVAHSRPSKEVPRLVDFASTFIDVYATNNNRPSTVREKRRALHRGLLDELGHLRLDDIGSREIERFKARRLEDGVGAKSVNEELSILSKLLDFANEIGDLPTAPPKIRRLKVRKPSFDFLDFDEAERLREAAEGAAGPWCTMIPFAMLTGLRLGELRALQWDDVDLVAARVQVRRSADDEGVLQPPKSGLDRVVDLPGRAVAILGAHRHLRGPFVFCREDGSMLQRWHCESKSKRRRDDSPLMKVCRKAGLRRVGWHVLRHTYASHLAMHGASLLEIKELLGHSNLQTTMRYAHLAPDARKRAVELLDRGHRGGTTGGTKRRAKP